MQYRKFGNTELVISEVGFGAWAIGGGAMIGDTAIGWGAVDDTISEQAVFAALDNGINFFDTADIYGLGHSEDILGKYIGNRDDIVIATKVGNVSRNQQFTFDYTKKYILEACEASLKRLQRETIDYYQLHTARLSHLQNGECTEAMQLLQQQGKIRYWGISLNTFDPYPEANYFIQQGMGNGFQLVLNLINKNALPLLQLAKEKGMGIIARMPLQFGLLTGKFDAAFSFPENDHRHKRITKAIAEATNEALQPVWDLCNTYQCSKTQLALSYILSYDEVTTVIPGIRTAQQAVDNTSGLFKLSNADKLLIENTPTAVLMQLILNQG